MTKDQLKKRLKIISEEKKQRLIARLNFECEDDVVVIRNRAARILKILST